MAEGVQDDVVSLHVLCAPPHGSKSRNRIRNVRRQSILEAARRGVWATPSSDASTHSPRVCLCVSVLLQAHNHTRMACACIQLNPLLYSPWLLTSVHTHTHTWLFFFAFLYPWQINLTHTRISTSHLFACRSWIPCLPCLSVGPAHDAFFAVSTRANCTLRTDSLPRQVPNLARRTRPSVICS